jgi:predicted DNA-binding transcriptional regulator AlpA
MPRRSTVRLTVHPDGRVSRAEAAKYLGLSAKTLAERKRKGLAPHDVKVGGRSFYYLQELDRFIAEGSPKDRLPVALGGS